MKTFATIVTATRAQRVRRHRRKRRTGQAAAEQGQVLRHFARRQERLRRRRGHDLRGHVQAQLPGQCLEICRQGHLRVDQDAQGHRLAEADRR